MRTGGETSERPFCGLGNDSILGEAGSDVYVLSNGDVADWIGNFEIDVEKSDVSAVTFIKCFSDLNATAAGWGAGSTWIYLDASNQVRLEGVSLASLQGSDHLPSPQKYNALREDKREHDPRGRQDGPLEKRTQQPIAWKQSCRVRPKPAKWFAGNPRRVACRLVMVTTLTT